PTFSGAPLSTIAPACLSTFATKIEERPILINTKSELATTTRVSQTSVTTITFFSPSSAVSRVRRCSGTVQRPASSATVRPGPPKGPAKATTLSPASLFTAA
ncbi:unnamed protein product, partial [Ectocarpus sp. 6 AP-2014]